MLWSWNVKLTAATYIKLNIFILLTTVNIQCSECYLLIICCFNYLSVHILTTPKLRKTDRKECLVFTTGHKWLFQTFLQFLFHHFLHHFHITSHSFQLVGIYCVWLSVTYCVFLIGLDIDKLYSSPLHKWLLIDERWRVNPCLHLAERRRRIV